MEDRKQQVLDKIEELRGKASKIFSVDLDHIDVSFALRGNRLARAGMREGKLYMQFNPQAMMDDKGWAHIFKNTVPHEMAHLVCFVDDKWGKGHNSGWKRVCRMLGGNGEAKATLNLELRTRRERQYAYIATCGTPITLSQTRHNRIRKGGSYILKSGGKINKECSFRQIS